MLINPHVELVTYTPNPDLLIATCARLCYKKDVESLTELMSSLDFDAVRNTIETLKSSRHLSPFEHASFTFYITNISRVCSHQLVRHRLASYTQQSQRYAGIDSSDDVNEIFIMPKSLYENEQCRNILQQCLDLYKQLGRDEDARYILPQAVKTSIVVTMNARELIHFFSLRLCCQAQEEIQEMALQMYCKVKEVAPLIFADIGPTCITYGSCPEKRRDENRCRMFLKMFR